MRKKSVERNILMNIFIILLSLSIIFISACGTTGNSETKRENNPEERKIVAKVNSNPIYEDQLTPYVQKGLRSFQKYGAKKDSPELVEQIKKKALDNVINKELLYQESQKLTIPDIEDKIQEKMDTIKSKYESEEKFEEGLKTKNMTEKDLKESLRKRVYIDEYLRINGISDPEVPEAEIKEYYDKNPKSFQRDETVDVSHILIVYESEQPEQKKKAREKAEKILKEILEGKDFAEMAKEHSYCKSAEGGGKLGYIKRGFMPEEFEKVAFTLNKDEISEVVETPFGFHIIKVHDKKSEGIAPYEDIKDFIGKFLKQMISKKKLASHIEELREKAQIEILLNN